MDSPDSKKLSEIVDRVRSWIPRKEPANLSRDFWMPDQSCRVCYECEDQFTVFNRRHHCRLCGRVFCAKCASNTIPALADECNTSREDWERIRVCNYCFNQWELGITTVDNGNAASSPGISPSSSVTSLISMHSGGTCNSKSTAGSIPPYSTGPYQHVPYASESGENPLQGDQIFDAKSGEDQATYEENPGSSNAKDPFPGQFGHCIIRSDDEEEDYSGWGYNSEPSQLQSDDRCYGTGNHVHNNENCTLHELDSDKGRDEADLQDLTLPPANVESYGSEVAENLCGAAADVLIPGVSEGGTQNDANPDDYLSLDFEKNGTLWLPPEPENEEDEQESLTFDDDDDGVAGDWGYLRSSRSFGGIELGNRERTIEEHRNAMKELLDDHFRSLLSQLLQIENLPASVENGKGSWLDIISSLSWEAATLLKPDMSKTGGMDPGIYVKVKCIASGHPSDSMVIKGVVCKKNVAHRRMAAKIDKARLIILGGALEYQRVANHLSSFDTLLQQEMDHLKMAVAKIEAHHPNVLIVEKSVSRFAQEYLLAKNISLVLNIKRPLLERIARCTGAQIVPSVDHNITAQKVGFCDSFRVEKFFEEHGSAGLRGKKMTKTLMFFDGCPKPLGCTILLRGASGDVLKKVKHVLHYGVFAAYHLALETSFLADEGASLPKVPLKSPIKVQLPGDLSSLHKSISFVSGSCASAPKHYLNSQSCVENVPRNDLIPHCTSRSLSFLERKSGSSGSPSATQMALAHMNSFDYDCSESNEFASEANCPTHLHPLSSGSVDVKQISSYHALGNEEDREPMNECFADGTTKSCVGEVDDNLVSSTSQSSEIAFCPALSLQESCPRDDDHQSILVSLTTRCEWKGTVCERAHLFRIKYYGSFDKPLGRFLRDQLFDQSYRCHTCEMPSAAHIHCYTHRQGSLTISVRQLQDLVLPGERDGKIWMWHRCLQCPRRNAFPPATRRVVMSDAAWGLSFGKFLELSFSNHAAASRVASCGHSLHRDCLRFYGFGRMVACFRYAPIHVNSVYLPPSKVEFTYDGQEWIQKEADEVLCRAESLFTEVVESLRQILEKTQTDNGGKDPRLIQQLRELESMVHSEKNEFEEMISHALKETRPGQPAVDILEINKLRRQLIIYAYVWDQRLVQTSIPSNHKIQDKNSLPPKEKEKTASSGENLANISTISTHSRAFSSCDSFILKVKPDATSVEEGDVNLCSPDGKDMDNNSSHIKDDEFSQPSPSSMDINLKNSEDPSKAMRRVFSEGQFPVVKTLSDTLDAAWTGESQQVVVTSRGVGLSPPDSAPSEASFIKPSIANQGTENCASTQKVPSGTGKSNGGVPGGTGKSNGGVPGGAGKSNCGVPGGTGKSNGGVPSTGKSNGGVWLPFSNFYRSFDSPTNPEKFDKINCYNPVHIFSFRELLNQNGARLLLPVGSNDAVVPVYDDEPTSIISYALVSPDYCSQMLNEYEKPKDVLDSSASLPILQSLNLLSIPSFEEAVAETLKFLGPADEMISPSSASQSSSAATLVQANGLHVRLSFSDDSPLGKVKYTVTCYFAKRFEALRQMCCPSELDFIRSLSRCKKWGAQGGKSNVFFAKTLDDRFIIKQVTKTELESFIKFADSYFKYLSKSVSTQNPTCLAKILGIYQVISKHLKGGKESRMDVLVMENLLYRRNIVKLYDLKGSSRSRYNPDSSGSNKVLLDQNLLETMPTSPLFVGTRGKRLLERAVWNDTQFLSSIDVMDYSLLVGVDAEKHELVVGIIDFMRQYTWDKHLETWVKASTFLGGSKNSSPTVVSPMQYKKRFRKAMSAYFLTVPNQWPSSSMLP